MPQVSGVCGTCTALDGSELGPLDLQRVLLGVQWRRPHPLAKDNLDFAVPAELAAISSARPEKHMSSREGMCLEHCAQ